MMTEGGFWFGEAGFEDDPELEHELVHPCSSGGGDSGDVTGLTESVEDLTLYPRGERQDQLGWHRYLHTGEGHVLPAKMTGTSEERSEIAVKRSGDRPVHPLFDQGLVDPGLSYQRCSFRTCCQVRTDGS